MIIGQEICDTYCYLFKIRRYRRTGWNSSWHLPLYCGIQLPAAGGGGPRLQVPHTLYRKKHIYFQKWNCASSFPIFTFTYLWEIYIFPRSVLSRLIVGIYKSFTGTRMLKLGDRALSFCFGNSEAAQFHFREYINRNQTFTLDSRRPFICNALRGKCRELLTYCFFSWTIFFRSPDNYLNFISVFFENSRRYSQLKLHDWCQRHYPCNSAKYFWNYSIFFKYL
jgi:hypothetical protein